MEITPQLLDDIAQELSIGNCCFLNIHTGEVATYPSVLKYDDTDSEFWQDVLDQVNDTPQDYIEIEGMESWESFGVMEDFISVMVPAIHQNRFVDAISKKHPFRRFNELLHDFESLRNQWFEYKYQRYMTFVNEQLESALGFTEEE